MTFFSIVSSPLPPSDVVYLVFFLKSTKKTFNFSRVSPPPWMVSPGPNDATDKWLLNLRPSQLTQTIVIVYTHMVVYYYSD